MKKVMQFLINVLADFPILLSLPFQILVKINLKIIDLFISLSSFLHVKFKTKTGQQIVLLNEKMKKLALITKAMEAAAEGTKETKPAKTVKPKGKGSSKLFDTIMGDDDDGSGQTFH